MSKGKKAARSDALRAPPPARSGVDPTGFHEALKRGIERQQHQKKALSDRFAARVARLAEQTPSGAEPSPRVTTRSKKKSRDDGE